MKRWKFTVATSDVEMNTRNLTSNIETALLSSSLITIMLGAIFLNTATVAIILRLRSLRQNLHNLLIVNLAVADLGRALTSMPFSLTSVFDDGDFLTSHNKTCKLDGFLSITFSFAGFTLILQIAMDRLLIVVFSHRFPIKRARVFVMIALSWLLGLVIASVVAGGALTSFEYHSSTKHCSPVWHEDHFGVFCSFLSFGLLFPITVSCYITITYHLWKDGRKLRRHQNLGALSTIKSPSTTNINTLPDRDAVIENWVFNIDSPANLRRPPPIPPPAESDVYLSGSGDKGISTDGAATGRKTRTRYKRSQKRTHTRVGRMGILLACGILVCWVPYSIYHSYLRTILDGPLSGVITMWLAYCSSIFNPLMYSFLNRRVRDELRRMGRRVTETCHRTRTPAGSAPRVESAQRPQTDLAL